MTVPDKRKQKLQSWGSGCELVEEDQPGHAGVLESARAVA